MNAKYIYLCNEMISESVYACMLHLGTEMFGIVTVNSDWVWLLVLCSCYCIEYVLVTCSVVAEVCEIILEDS
jgi:hypothetical protein